MSLYALVWVLFFKERPLKRHVWLTSGRLPTNFRLKYWRSVYESQKGERRTKVMNNDSISSPIRISKNRLSRILLLAIMIESAGVLLLVISFVWLWKGRKSMKHYQELRESFKMNTKKVQVWLTERNLQSTNLKNFLRKRNSYIFLKEFMKIFVTQSNRTHPGTS